MSAEMEQVKVRVGPDLCRHRLGVELRRLREAAYLRLEDVAAALEIVPSTLSRIETGQQPTRTAFACAMLDMYRVEDPAVRQRLENLAREGQGKSWLSDFGDVLPAGALAYLRLEPAASVVRSFAALTVPDLAQTRDYARALCRALYPPLSARQAGKLAMVTMLRQELARGDTGRRVHLVADEAVLLRRIGSPDVMARQLHALAAMTADGPVTVQVTPMRQARAVLTSSFTVLSFTGPDAPDVACRGEAHDTAGVTRRAGEVTALAGAFAALSHSALPPGDSADLIRRLAEEAQA